MLNQLLHEIKTAPGPITVRELSQILAVESNAIEGMIQFLVHKGILQDDDNATKCKTDSGVCSTSSCGNSACVFIAKMPKTYSTPWVPANQKPLQKP